MAPQRAASQAVSVRRPTQSGRRDRNIVVGPVAALPAWRINDTRNVTTRREHVALLPSRELLNGNTASQDTM